MKRSNQDETRGDNRGQDEDARALPVNCRTAIAGEQPASTASGIARLRFPSPTAPYRMLRIGFAAFGPRGIFAGPLSGRTRRGPRAKVCSDLGEHVGEGVGGDADLAAERKVELYDQGDDDDNRAGETG